MFAIGDIGEARITVFSKVEHGVLTSVHPARNVCFDRPHTLDSILRAVVLDCELMDLLLLVVFMLVPGAADSLDVLWWRVRLNPFIEFRVNLVAVLFVVGVFFSDSSRGAVFVDLLDRVVFSFFRSVVGVVAWWSWST